MSTGWPLPTGNGGAMYVITDAFDHRTTTEQPDDRSERRG